MADMTTATGGMPIQPRALLASGAHGSTHGRSRCDDDRQRGADLTTPDGVAEWLCRELEPMLIGSLTLYCGDREVAVELAQETLVRMWDRWDRVRALDNPLAWGHRVAFNLANSWYRRRSAEARARRRLRARPAAATELDIADRLAVRRAVAALPTRQRTALVLRYYVDMTSEQAAQVMGCRPATVRTLTLRAIGSLRAAGLHVDAEGSDDA